MPLSSNSLTLLLLCSHLGPPNNEAAAPLTLREWNPIARKLSSSSLAPGDLLGISTADLETWLGIDAAQADRLAHLLARTDEIQGELNRLESRGIYPLTRYEAGYPECYQQRLKDSAPPVLFCSGEKALLGQPGIAVVGSRHLDEAGQACAEFVGNACGLSGQVLYSGGARGVDTIAMMGALVSRGSAVGILADSLEKAVRELDWHKAIERGDLCLVSPYAPNAGFSVGAAMGRNRLIYALADYAIVVASEVEKGGTWAGATDALRQGWIPVFALEHPAMPDGNRMLLKRGALPFPHPFPESPLRLPGWLQERSPKSPQPPVQASLF